MTKEEMGRLILQANSGMHGNVAKKLADALVAQLEVTDQQQAEIDVLRAGKPEAPKPDAEEPKAEEPKADCAVEAQ